MTNLTADQKARIATMSPADAACWTAWYTERNEMMAAAQREAEGVIRAMLAAQGQVEPGEARKLASVDARTFNAAVRFLKFTGSVMIDEAGMLIAA